MDTSMLQFSTAVSSKKLLFETLKSPPIFSIQKNKASSQKNYCSTKILNNFQTSSKNIASSFRLRRIYGSVSSQNGPCLRASFQNNHSLFFQNNHSLSFQTNHFLSAKKKSFSSTISLPKRSMETVVTGSLPVSSANAQLAGALFTFGTTFVMPMYTAMLFAPNQPLTRKFVESPLPYVVLGALYLYLLSLSWTPETLSLMFASKYWLPELPGITRMFSSTLTVASAWIHLLAVDLFAARQVFLDGLHLKMETRHSLVLCLMFGPIGILSHSLTKMFISWSRHGERDELRDDPLIRTSVGI